MLLSALRSKCSPFLNESEFEMFLDFNIAEERDGQLLRQKIASGIQLGYDGIAINFVLEGQPTEKNLPIPPKISLLDIAKGIKGTEKALRCCQVSVLFIHLTTIAYAL